MQGFQNKKRRRKVSQVIIVFFLSDSLCGVGVSRFSHHQFYHFNKKDGEKLFKGNDN